MAVAVTVLTLYAALAIGAQPVLPPLVVAPPGEAADTLATVPLPNLRERLELLSPADPQAYFLLAEELAAEVEVAPSARRLAQHLFVLSYELRRGQAGIEAAAGRSVCLALASIAGSDSERRWLLAMARSLDVGRTDPQFEAPGPGPTRREAALDLATALGYVRAGEGRRAEPLMARPAVRELLEQYQGLLSGPGMSVGAATIRRYMDQWPVCPECRNHRITRRSGEGGGTTTLCYTCRGNPGPTLSDEEVLLQLRLESALLSGIQRSWAAQVAIDAGAPLRDLDPAELAATFSVDPSRPLWRDGQWREAEGFTPAPRREAAPRRAPAPGSDTPESQT